MRRETAYVRDLTGLAGGRPLRARRALRSPGFRACRVSKAAGTAIGRGCAAARRADLQHTDGDAMAAKDEATWRVGVLFSRSGVSGITETEHFLLTALAI